MSIVSYEQHPLWMVAGRDKNSQTRIGQFVAWQQGREAWYQPSLAAYRDDLLEDGLLPSTVSSYLSTIRGAYRKLSRSNHVRDMLMAMAPVEASPADKHAFVEEVLTRLRNATHPDESHVKQTIVQDRADSAGIRLTPGQAQDLLSAPGLDTDIGIRDTALLALCLCTGVREDELCSLVVEDLWQELSGELALQIRHGKGDKQRLVPYGDLEWCLSLVEMWLDRANISEGPVFRGFYARGGVRPDALTTRTVQRIVKQYPVMINGGLQVIRPHDLRRTYARLMYEAGMDLVAIQQNLGHASIETTMTYIGELDVKRRRGRAVFEFNISASAYAET